MTDELIDYFIDCVIDWLIDQVPGRVVGYARSHLLGILVKYLKVGFTIYFDNLLDIVILLSFISTLSVNNCFQILFKILNVRNYVAPHLYLYAVLWLMILFSLNNYFRLKIEMNKKILKLFCFKFVPVLKSEILHLKSVFTVCSYIWKDYKGSKLCIDLKWLMLI